MCNTQNSFFQPPTKEQLADIIGEFDATEESVKKDVATLKEWIEKQPHLPTIEDDEWLANFLLTCKNSLQKTKTSIDTYYTAKTLMPDVFLNRDPCSKDIESTFRYCTYVPCPKLTSDGYRIVIFHIFGKTDEDLPTAENLTKMIQIILDTSLKLDYNKGIILIYNMENCTAAFVKVIIPLLKKFATLTTKVTPRRQRKMYIVNSAPYVNVAIKFIKSIISKKMSDRIEMWNDDVKNLTKVLPKEVLPVDFGGEEKSIEELRENWYEEVKRHREWLIAGEEEKADMSKKPVNASDNDESVNFGMQGSFRTLHFD